MMCEWGTIERVLVPVPADLSHTGGLHWVYKPIDRCIADIVRALNSSGVHTSDSCCGHGEDDGRIDLHDGRTLVVQRDNGQDR